MAWKDAGLGSGATSVSNGYRFTKNGVNLYFPMTGIRMAGSGIVKYVDTQSYYWTNTSSTTKAWSSYALGLYAPTAAMKSDPAGTLLRSAGAMIRCMKE